MNWLLGFVKRKKKTFGSQKQDRLQETFLYFPVGSSKIIGLSSNSIKKDPSFQTIAPGIL